MKLRKLGIFALIVFIAIISIGVVSAQESTEAAQAETAQEFPQPPGGQPIPPDGQPQPPDGEVPPVPPGGQPVPPNGQPQPPDGEVPPVPPDGQPVPPDGVDRPQPPNGQPPQPPRYPQWHYVQQTTTITTTTVYPSQVLLLRHIEQTIADAVGLTRSDVNTLRLSMTFDEVVTMYGGDANAVRTQAIADLQSWIVEGMTDGTITQARGTLLLNNLYQIVDRAFTGAFNVNGSTVTGLLDS